MFAAEAKRLNSELKGMHRIGITSFAYFPLQSATSEAPALIQKAADSVENLKDDTLPDLEIIAFPGYFTTITVPEAGKSWIQGELPSSTF
ncbi:hypothetical protein B0H13DRAFT_2319806 [Mycena leptocephala]|nr:hypothetical protein B0H13DRAFT_2319806 [Mycena leptocephala]